MYIVDDEDKVSLLDGFPQWDAGAPLPVVFSDESTTIVGYILQNSVSINADDNAFIKFSRCYAHMFGPPNDEAFHGHPLGSAASTLTRASVLKTHHGYANSNE